MSLHKGLTVAENERLAIHGEECGENNKVLGKIQRHGYRSYNPQKPELGTNRQHLTEEAGDVFISVMLLIMAGDLSLEEVNERIRHKLSKMSDWMRSPENVELVKKLYEQLYGLSGSGGISCLFSIPPIPRSDLDFPPANFDLLSGSISSKKSP
jgi:NTP pyrophosphatase (non-canonical NTP hydrolase)